MGLYVFDLEIEIQFFPFIRKHVTLLSFSSYFLVFTTEHGQKFPGLRPANAAGLDGSQQKWAETGPGRACTEASAD